MSMIFTSIREGRKKKHRQEGGGKRMSNPIDHNQPKTKKPMSRLKEGKKRKKEKKECRFSFSFPRYDPFGHWLFGF